VTPLVALPADGVSITWETWDAEHVEHLRLDWENEAWTAVGEVGRERITYVIRLSPTWHVRQLLLFRDLDQPDLWLATDGHARWGEMNGDHRTELDGCTELSLECTPFTLTLPIRRLRLGIGDETEVRSVAVDVDTLAVVPRVHHYRRVGERRWQHRSDDTDETYDVDEHGLALDVDGRFRRAAPTTSS
jgi:uncharacterized protein